MLGNYWARTEARNRRSDILDDYEVWCQEQEGRVRLALDVWERRIRVMRMRRHPYKRHDPDVYLRDVRK